jgi:hypothetical protein
VSALSGWRPMKYVDKIDENGRRSNLGNRKPV